MALQALFFLDVNSKDPEKDLSAFCEERQEELGLEVKPFFLELVRGVMAEMEMIDKLLDQYSRNWKLSRMSVVDRNIMRIAAFELIKRQDIPPSVSINEAVEIGKKYGTRESGPFINGILDRIRQTLE